MCGIAGIAGRADEALGRAMADTLAHRGPDDAGVYTADGVTLSHRRLSIIDVEGGHQPMAGACGNTWIVYNGEIYNFRELRRTLEGEGHRFRTNSDTEVILAAYAEYGSVCVEHLQGMFAFALWDAQEKTLLLARDPLGVKPLYYARHEQALYFASELKAILAVPGMPREIDFPALDDYLTYLYTVPPRTMFKAIRQLPPGHLATWREGSWTERRYWRLTWTQEDRSASEWIARAGEQVEKAVTAHLVSDVPVGAFLSGGLDSATIVYFMKQALAEPVHTFTVGFGREGSRYDESAQASGAAAHLGAVHHGLEARGNVADLLHTMVHHFDEPFGNPTALLSYSISALVREHVKVILSGDGGDEVFGGYPRYAGVRFAGRYRRIPELLRRGILNPLAQCLPESVSGRHVLRRLREFSAGALLDPVDMYIAWRSYYTPAEKTLLYTPDTTDAIGEHDASAFLRGLAHECPFADPVTRAMYIDLHSFLPNNVLHYGDRMSMAHGLEVRVPFADHKLVESMMQAPSALKLRGRETKYLLRQSMRGKLPCEILRRPKTGFNPPMGVWLLRELKPLVDDYLAPGALRKHGHFNPETVQQMIQMHAARKRDYTWHLWALLVFEEWHRQYLDS